MIYILYSILGIIALLIVLLALPLSVKVSYDKHLIARIYYAGICVKNTAKKKTAKKPKSGKTAGSAKEQEKPSFVKKLMDERGFKGTVKYFTSVIKIALTVLKGFLKHIKISRFNLKIIVSGDDAARVAINYGEVCAGVYPLISLIAANTKFKAKHIDIYSDFDNNKSDFYVYFKIKTNLLTGIVFELLKDKKLKKIIKECEKL